MSAEDESEPARNGKMELQNTQQQVLGAAVVNFSAEGVAASERAPVVETFGFIVSLRARTNRTRARA